MITDYSDKTLPSSQIALPVAVLGILISASDGIVSQSEVKLLLRWLRNKLSLSGDDSREILRAAAHLAQGSMSLYEAYSWLQEELSRGHWRAVLRLLNELAYADGDYSSGEQEYEAKIKAFVGSLPH